LKEVILRKIMIQLMNMDYDESYQLHVGPGITEAVKAAKLMRMRYLYRTDEMHPSRTLILSTRMY
jgi:hypothetical protein